MLLKHSDWKDFNNEMKLFCEFMENSKKPSEYSDTELIYRISSENPEVRKVFLNNLKHLGIKHGPLTGRYLQFYRYYDLRPRLGL